MSPMVMSWPLNDGTTVPGGSSLAMGSSSVTSPRGGDYSMVNPGPLNSGRFRPSKENPRRTGGYVLSPVVVPMMMPVVMPMMVPACAGDRRRGNGERDRRRQNVTKLLHVDVDLEELDTCCKPGWTAKVPTDRRERRKNEMHSSSPPP